MKTLDESYKVYQYTHIEHSDGCRNGHYFCTYGIVMIYSDDENFRVLLETIVNGRTHYRTITGKKYTDIGLARKAGEFIRELNSQ